MHSSCKTVKNGQLGKNQTISEMFPTVTVYSEIVSIGDKVNGDRETPITLTPNAARQLYFTLQDFLHLEGEAILRPVALTAEEYAERRQARNAMTQEEFDAAATSDALEQIRKLKSAEAIQAARAEHEFLLKRLSPDEQAFYDRLMDVSEIGKAVRKSMRAFLDLTDRSDPNPPDGSSQ